MWISQKIRSDPEVKKTLREITRLIKNYSDATRIEKDRKFFTSDIGGGWFQPRVSNYLIILFIFTMTELLLFWSDFIHLSILNEFVRLSLTISVPILVLGIPLATVAKSISESSRFASEYLKDSCQITLFACLTFLTVFFGYLGSLLFSTIESLFLPRITYLILSSFSIGGTIWCLTSLIHVIVEITKCTQPEFSTEAAANYATRKLISAFLKDVYISVWMGKYSYELDEELKKFENIYPPSKYMTKEFVLNSGNKEEKEKLREYQIRFPKEINFHLGYKDYNLRKIEKINKSLKDKNAKLYLTPHGSFPKEFGALRCEKPCSEIYNSINKKLSSICRFRKDKHIEVEESFFEEYYLKIRSSLFRTIEDSDIAQFRKYLSIIEEIHRILRKVRKDEIVRKYQELEYKKTRCLLIYPKSVRWLLESSETIEDDIIETFFWDLEKSIWNQVEDDIRKGDWYTINILRWLLPETYLLFNKFKDRKSRLWELRARLGGFYDFAGGLLSQYESDIKEEDKLQIKLVLHKGIIKWLLIAIDNKDNELIKSLCEAVRRLVFPDKEIIFSPQQLVAQHFVLCGKMLEFLMGKKEEVSPDIFKLLIFEKYDHTAKMSIDHNELVQFFIESRKYDLSSLIWEFSDTDWERNPLSGGGVGTPRHTFSGNIELDNMFIYLALLNISVPSECEIKPTPFDFSGYRLKEKIVNFKDIARNIEIYDFKDSKNKLEKWLDECDQLYEQREEKRIAETPLNKEIVSQYKDAFWEGYKSVKTFLRFCIKQGYYTKNNDVSVKGRYIQRKEIFIGGRASHEPYRDGTDISRSYDRNLLKKLINPDAESEIETADNITSQLNQACQWLTKEGTNKESGILLLYGNNAGIQRELYNNDCYVPSWREDRGLVFSGYYKNYPMIEIHDPEKAPKCVALNLQGWKGIKIRSEVLEKDILGEINVREWTEEEINEAIRKKEIEEEDRNKVKGNCPVEYELFWCLDEKDLPMQKAVSLKTETSTS